MKGNPDFNPRGGDGDNLWLANVKLISNTAGGAGAFFVAPLINRLSVAHVKAYTETYYGQWLSEPVGIIWFGFLFVLIFGATRTGVSEAIKRYRGRNPPGPLF